jgi:hypothetical protein
MTILTARRPPAVAAGPRRRSLSPALTTGMLALATLAIAACSSFEQGSHTDNRNPDMRHGNIEKPGTHARD